MLRLSHWDRGIACVFDHDEGSVRLTCIGQRNQPTLTPLESPAFPIGFS